MGHERVVVVDESKKKVEFEFFDDRVGIKNSDGTFLCVNYPGYRKNFVFWEYTDNKIDAFARGSVAIGGDPIPIRVGDTITQTISNEDMSEDISLAMSG